MKFMDIPANVTLHQNLMGANTMKELGDAKIKVHSKDFT
jgi:hypothetical protein